MGKIFNIQRLCVDDGPGIRTTVFLGGCPLRCRWCHNPEGWCTEGEIFYFEERCVSCGRCAALCPAHTIEDGKHRYDRAQCKKCGACVGIGCGALENTTREMSAKEGIDVALRDVRYYHHSGGGITFSGGEPMLQFSFLKEMIALAKAAGLHIALETSGVAPFEHYLEILPDIDLFLYDLKLTDPEAHERYVGAPLTPILENLERLNAHGASIILRCIIVPGVNDTDAHFQAIGALADSLDGVREIHLEPYHEIYLSKRERLGSPLPEGEFRVASAEEKTGYPSRVPTRKPCIL